DPAVEGYMVDIVGATRTSSIAACNPRTWSGVVTGSIVASSDRRFRRRSDRIPPSRGTWSTSWGRRGRPRSRPATPALGPAWSPVRSWRRLTGASAGVQIGSRRRGVHGRHRGGDADVLDRGLQPPHLVRRGHRFDRGVV